MRRYLLLPLLAASLSAADWKQDLLFHASFDGSVDAQTAQGDKTLYSAPNYKEPGKPGLEGSGVEFVPNGGRHGGALKFPVSNTKAVFFKAPNNFNFKEGTISVWLKLDPDLDLAPGYCDPLQVTAKAYNDSAIWVDFTKDDKPRHMRLGVFGGLKSWNPNNLSADKFHVFDNRLVNVAFPPFSRDRWTHVAITYSGLGTSNGTASLYFDGRIQGATSPIAEAFQWEEANVTFRLGVNYVGLLDDLAMFRRPLTAAEIVELGKGL